MDVALRFSRHAACSAKSRARFTSLVVGAELYPKDVLEELIDVRFMSTRAEVMASPLTSVKMALDVVPVAQRESVFLRRGARWSSCLFL